MHTQIILEYFAELVSEECGITVKQMKSHKRTREYVTARQIFCYMARKYSSVTKAELGEFLGNRDHTTIIHSLNSFNQIVDIYADVKNLVTAIDEKDKFKKVSIVHDDLIQETIKAIKEDPESIAQYVNNLYNQAYIKGLKREEEAPVKKPMIKRIPVEGEVKIEKPKAVYSNKSWI